MLEKQFKTKAFEQIELIKATPDATNEEKQAAIAKVNSELAKAQEQINSEHTTQRVNDAKTNAVSTIGQITAQPIEKQAARDAINQKQMNKLHPSMLIITLQMKKSRS